MNEELEKLNREEHSTKSIEFDYKNCSVIELINSFFFFFLIRLDKSENKKDRSITKKIEVRVYLSEVIKWFRVIYIYILIKASRKREGGHFTDGRV